MVGIFFKQYIPSSTWVGCIMAIVGLYLICVKENFNISYGEGLQLVATLLWTMHILLVDHFSKQVDVLKLSFIQFITCSALSLLTALFFETINMQAFSESLVSLLYGGVCSVGIAFTLQIIGQKHAEPSHAAIIFSMETVFAAVGGWVILGENLGIRESWGCGIMLVGMLLSQLQNVAKNENEEKHIQGIPG
jgi:drug/metabolite transporter (DMT)-like permease